MIHPSGDRDLTDREFASLQGFPLEQKFGGVGVKKQIGNAVPPVVARVILEGVRRALERVDGVVDGGGVGTGGLDGTGDGVL